MGEREVVGDHPQQLVTQLERAAGVGAQPAGLAARAARSIEPVHHRLGPAPTPTRSSSGRE